LDGATLSLCIIVKDEAASLPKCVASARAAVDEIIVVDTGSSDNTVAVARELGAAVYNFAWRDSFSEARNYALSRATREWILMLDADEEVDAAAVGQIGRLLADTACEGYYLRIRSYIGRAAGREYLDDCRLSLFRNRPEYRYEGAIHETVAAAIERVGAGRTTVADVLIHHYGYLNDIWLRKDKTNRNVTLLRKSVQKTPGDGYLRYCLGSELIGQNDFAAALGFLLPVAGEWTPRNPRYSDLIKKIGMCYLASGRIGDGRDILERGTELYPDYTDLWLLLGQAYLMQSRYYQAEKCFRRCLQLKQPPAWYISLSGAGSYLPCLELARMKSRQAESLTAYLQPQAV